MREEVTYSFNVQDRAVNNYYPFGMFLLGLCYSSDDFRFGFNGKENDDVAKGKVRMEINRSNFLFKELILVLIFIIFGWFNLNSQIRDLKSEYSVKFEYEKTILVPFVKDSNKASLEKAKTMGPHFDDFCIFDDYIEGDYIFLNFWF